MATNQSAEWIQLSAQYAGAAWESTKELLNSNFSVAVFGAFAGAVAGAYAARKIAETTEIRKQLKSEMNIVRAANTISTAIYNSALALKKQHVKELVDRYGAARAEYLRLKELHASGRGPRTPTAFECDFRKFGAPSVPISNLREVVFKSETLEARALSAVYMIEQHSILLADAIQRREHFVDKVKKGDIPQDLIVPHYFGDRLPSGNIDKEYMDLIHAIGIYLDDVIFYSSLLCRDLSDRIKALKQALIGRKKKPPKDVPLATITVFNEEAQSLMPPDSNYADWLKGFVGPADEKVRPN